MESIKLDITDLLDITDKTTILFYKQDEKKGFQMLEETVIKLTIAIESILLYKSQVNREIIDEELLNKVLADLTNAIGDRDIILISDILEFEVKKMLQEIMAKV